MKRPRFLPLLAGFALVLAACGTASGNADDVTESPDAEGLSVVVTTTVWGDIVSEVTGDSATVEVLYPVGADPHDYQLSSSQVASMQEADLVVFGEALLPGYPFWPELTDGARFEDDRQKDIYACYAANAVDIAHDEPLVTVKMHRRIQIEPGPRLHHPEYFI